MSTGIGYGFFPGGDPRKFTPDEEMNTASEIRAWELACEAWNNGDEKVIAAGCVLVGGMLVTITELGMGTYQYEDDDEEEGTP